MCNRDPTGCKVLDIDDFPYYDWSAEKHRKIVGRTLMLTSEHYVGWAPHSAAVGDIVSIIPGCHVPIVLRRVSGGDVRQEVSACSQVVEGISSQRLEDAVMSFKVIGEACKGTCSPF